MVYYYIIFYVHKIIFKLFFLLGVGSVIAGKILSVSDIGHTLIQLGWFVITVAIGLFLYHFIVMQLIYFIVLRKNPFKFYCMLLHPMFTAAACASK